mmetsp:Transcript_65135/g.114913  ORF Transcript_65135/g.114913 Transcript_65135/m.114913 type:complete len:718 (-) Transcript_65135:1341-3494(-)
MPESSTESAAWVKRRQTHLEVVGLDVDRFDQSGHARHVLVLLLTIHPERCLSFFCKEVAVVLGLELLDRNEEVSEMQLEGVGVQGSVEQTLHKARHLLLGDIGESLDQQATQVLLEELGIVHRITQRVQGGGDLTELGAVAEVHQNARLQLEATLVQAIRQHPENILYEGQHELLEKRLCDLIVATHIAQQGQQDLQTCLTDISLGVLNGPHNAVNDQLLQVGGDAEERVETVAVCLVDEREKRDSVLGVVQHVGGDHLQGLFEQGIQNARNVGGNVVFEHADRSAEQHQYLVISGGRRGGVVVLQHFIHDGREEVLVEQFLRMRTVKLLVTLSAGIQTSDEEFQNVCFNPSHGLVHRESRGDGSLLGTGLDDLLTIEAVHVQHVVEDVAQLVQVDAAGAADHTNVDAQNLRQLLDGFYGGKTVDVLRAGLHGFAPAEVLQFHQPQHHLLARHADRGTLIREHGADGLVEGLHLVRLKIADVSLQVADQRQNERLRVLHLRGHEFSLALLADLQKGVTRHVLHSGVVLVHKLEQFVHHSLQKLPVCAQKARILTNNVHDVTGDHCLVVLAPLFLTQSQQVLDHTHQEPLFVQLAHGPGDGTNGPAQSVQTIPTKHTTRHLQIEFFEHDGFCVLVVEVGQVHNGLAHGLVLRNHFGIFGLLTHDLAVVVFYNDHLLWLGHVVNHQYSQVVQNALIERLLASSETRTLDPTEGTARRAR